MLSVLVPFALIGSAAALQGVGVIQDMNEGSIKVALGKLQQRLGLEIDHKAQLEAVKLELEHLQAAAEHADRLPRSVEGDQVVIPAEILRYGNKLGEAFDKLREVIAADNKDNPKTAWEERLQMLARDARTFGQRINDEDSSYLDASTQISRNFRNLREELLGGIYLRLIKDLANPDQQTLASAFQSVREYVQPRLLSLTSATVGFTVRMIIGTAILIICVFFFLYDGPGMVKTIMALIPLDDRYEAELLLEFDRVSRAVVLATVFSAITQGAVAGLGYYVAGMPSLVLLIMLTTMCAMIPFVGPAIVWVPACLYLAFYENRILTAGGLALWGVLVVGTVDNFVKAGVLHGQSQLHPLLALLSVLGGVQALGPLASLWARWRWFCCKHRSASCSAR